MSTQIITAPCGSTVESPASGVSLVVQHRLNVLDDVAETVVLTEDGRHAITSEWHSGPEAQSVWVERWNAFGQREFHGCVDSVSRKLVQVG